jgi:hypothetical protein
MSASIIYFGILNDNTNNPGGQDAFFSRWIQDFTLKGMSIEIVEKCAKEILDLMSTFKTRYPELNNMETFESNLL